ncbi:1296_t:CDS:2, partial [Racocetra persica]
DLKLENILLDTHKNIKLGDFGFTREYESKKLLETRCGSTEAKDLIKSILQLEPKERPTLKQILQHAWFTKNEKEPIRQATIAQSGNNNDAIGHLERQRHEIFLLKQKQDAQNCYPTGFIRNKGNDVSSVAPSAFQTRLTGMTTAIDSCSTSRKTFGPSTSKSSRRSSIDSKTFNEKIFFTTPEEKELLDKLEGLGFDVQAIKSSVLEGKVDSASGLWWLLLTRLREKIKIEVAPSSVTMVDVAVGTSDDELEIADDIEEEPDSMDSPVDSNMSSQEDDCNEIIAENSIKVPEKMLPPTPPPKTYHTAPASRERRKSLILSLPEAVEPVLTAITATASPPLSPKKFSSFTSPLSSRSVSPIPHISITPITIQLPNSKDNRKKSILSTIKGWLGGSSQQTHKDSSSAYKKSMLNWTESGIVVPADVARSQMRIVKRNDGKTPLSYDSTSSINIRRRSSSISRGGSIKDRKKKNRNSFQGNKSRRSSTAPLTIPPVTPSVVLSHNSPIGMSPIPGTPPAVRHKTMFTINRRNPFTYTGNSWGRKQVKRRSIGGSSISSSIQENLDAEVGSGSGSSENANNHQDKDTFETSAIENISDDTVKNDTLTIDGHTIIDNNSEPSISKQKKIDLQKVDESSHKIREEDVTSSDDGEESDTFIDASSEIASHPRSRTPSPSPFTAASPLSNDSPVLKPYGTIINPLTFPYTPFHNSNSTSIISQIPVSPPLSPADNNSEVSPTSPRKSHQRLNSLPATLNSGSGVKQRDVYIPPIEKSQALAQSVIDFMSTPPDSPKLPSPTITPSSSSTSPHTHITKSSQLRQSHSRSHSSPTIGNNIGNSKVDVTSRNETSRKDSSSSSPNGLNNAQLLTVSSPMALRRKNLITTKPSVIMEEEEEEC